MFNLKQGCNGMDNTIRHSLLRASLISLGLVLATPSFATETAQPAQPQTQPEASQLVQPKVDKLTAEAMSLKRKALMADASAALAETHKALKALENKKPDVAVKALEEATGKLDLIVARDPKLAQAPVETEVVTYDLMTDLETIKKITKDAKAYLNDGEIQKARPLVANLASEIQYRTLHISLATYPSAIKAIAPLIDAGKIDEAKAGLQAALNMRVPPRTR